MPLIVLFFLSLGSVAIPSPSKNDALITKIQTAWDGIKNYQASFHQTIKAKRMGTTDESDGEVVIEKPGKIRWDIKSDGKLQILNGNRLTHVHTSKRKRPPVVEVYENISTQLDTRSLSFLSSGESFKKSYVVKIAKETSKMVSLKLVPRTGLESDSYIAEFDKSSYLLRSLITDSADTSVRTDFAEIRTNQSLSDELFVYKPGPKDVVTVNK